MTYVALWYLVMGLATAGLTALRWRPHKQRDESPLDRALFDERTPNGAQNESPRRHHPDFDDPV